MNLGEFEKVAAEVKGWKQISTNNSEFYQLYGLYKQSLLGDFDESKAAASSKPENESVKKPKREAWLKNNGLSQDAAKQNYIELASKLRGKMA